MVEDHVEDVQLGTIDAFSPSAVNITDRNIHGQFPLSPMEEVQTTLRSGTSGPKVARHEVAASTAVTEKMDGSGLW
eukprot:CAMPEP_0172317796 /NCGR_PEP_ID=MMETSP1058-20130122/32789_1 /TAXON_ID=83371 /ORGANISM="Detonula confervacea, Strain CCMP 353" /LENGTH=75 /DNA_ID=CAMNT_0013032429 /DNA_START=219 /DNA_END=446 /DNA_ORIENTATION=+